MSIDGHLTKGSEYIRDKNYTYAIYEYDKVLQESSSSSVLLPNGVGGAVPAAYLGRAYCFLLLEKYTQALQDTKTVTQLQPDSVQGWYQQGQALFGLEDYTNARQAFQTAKTNINNRNTSSHSLSSSSTSSSTTTIDGSVTLVSLLPVPTLTDIDQWIRKCTAELEGAITVIDNNTVLSPFKPRFEWYQTNTHVTISYLSKEINSVQSTITVPDNNNKQLSIALAGPSTTSPFTTILNLYENVQKDETVISYRPTKVEIRLTKDTNAQFMWPTLEESSSTVSPDAIKAKLIGNAVPASNVSSISSSSLSSSTPSIPSNIASTVPSSSSKPLPTPYASKKNWDALEKEVIQEEENEKPEGEEALQKLFRQIYKNGDEDTRRAMIKSFQTSGGTVLSTNWKDVAQHDYEKEGIKAPEGMEVRKWNQ